MCIRDSKSMWHHGIAVDPGLLGNVTQLATVWIDNRFENIAAILLSWMLGDPHFSFHRSLPFLILSILTKKNLYVRSYKYFAFYALVRPKFSFLDYVSFFKVYFSSEKDVKAKVYLVMLNWVRLPDLKITNMAYFIADRCTLRSS